MYNSISQLESFSYNYDHPIYILSLMSYNYLITFYFICIYTAFLMIYTQDTIPLGVTIYRMLQLLMIGLCDTSALRQLLLAELVSSRALC